MPANNNRLGHLKLILGPMASGKSLELISNFSSLRYTTIKYGLFQSALNVREDEVKSRDGVSLPAQKIKSIGEILKDDYEVVGIDEGHMFMESDIKYVKELLTNGTDVIVSMLAMDYRGEMMKMAKLFLELGPIEVKFKAAACSECHKPGAAHTQIFYRDSGEPVLGDLPQIIPDDGSYIYRPVCLKCFRATKYDNL